MLRILFPAFFSFFFFTFQSSAMIFPADTLPYYEIPDYPEDYSSATVAARTVDGLGFRYYWATEGLTEEDLAYKPSEDSRTIRETAEHILSLTSVTLNAVLSVENGRNDYSEMSFAEIRKATLMNIQRASDKLKSADGGKVDEMKIIFRRGEDTNEFPFWNLLNGPLADAIYHTGQIVGYRRAAGNPMPPGVSVFSGKVRAN